MKKRDNGLDTFNKWHAQRIWNMDIPIEELRAIGIEPPSKTILKRMKTAVLALARKLAEVAE